MYHCTRKLLGLTDENLFFEEEWLETVEEDGFRTNLIHDKLSYILSHCRKCGIKNEGQIIKNGSHKTKANFCLTEQPKQNYAWYVRAFTVKNVSRHSTLRPIW